MARPGGERHVPPPQPSTHWHIQRGKYFFLCPCPHLLCATKHAVLIQFPPPPSQVLTKTLLADASTCFRYSYYKSTGPAAIAMRIRLYSPSLGRQAAFVWVSSPLAPATLPPSLHDGAPQAERIDVHMPALLPQEPGYNPAYTPVPTKTWVLRLGRMASSGCAAIIIKIKTGYSQVSCGCITIHAKVHLREPSLTMTSKPVVACFTGIMPDEYGDKSGTCQLLFKSFEYMLTNSETGTKYKDEASFSDAVVLGVSLMQANPGLVSCFNNLEVKLNVWRVRRRMQYVKTPPLTCPTPLLLRRWNTRA